MATYSDADGLAVGTTKPAGGGRWKHTCPHCGRPVKAHTSYSQQGATISHFECAYPKQLRL